MKKTDVVAQLLKNQFPEPVVNQAQYFAPTNIALCKYWGKRNTELNLPVNSSLSISLADKGATIKLAVNDKQVDEIFLNTKKIAEDSQFYRRLIDFIDLFRPKKNWNLDIEIEMNIPVAAGLASSACGFAAVSLALQKLLDLHLSEKQLSILARLGSGSAARSIWKGFVEWHAGIDADGMDSFAEPLNSDWPELKMGLIVISDKEKLISSRVAMQRTVDTSILYGCWPKKVMRDLVIIRQAINNQNFNLLAGAAESNALSMHATMMSSWPPICYSLPETIAAMQRVWKARDEGLSLFFTQDAGPNLKLLFLEASIPQVKEVFPEVEICSLG